MKQYTRAIQSFPRALFTLMAAATILTACVFAPDGDGRHYTQSPTIGQELLDLDKARAAGAISDGEYQRLKDKLIAR
ncbi:MAG: SHOCT domain-containing protein [Pseudomonadales bacterium]|nr:SHOCT domain-containing protein [Pseudomonadales bacterium]